MKLLVSACLLGFPCRYDGRAKPHEGVLSLLETHTLIRSARRSTGDWQPHARRRNGRATVS